LPPFPHRTTERLLYPVGEFNGVWTALELRYAVECGAKVKEIHRGLFWESKEVLLAEYFAWLYSKRLAAKDSNPVIAAWLKWILNSCTGKFAQYPENERVLINPENPEKLICPADWNCRGGTMHGVDSARCCTHECTGTCGRWHTLDRAERIYVGKYWKIPQCGFVEWAAYLTAFVRCYWHKAASQAGAAMVYGDTDSIYSETPFDTAIVGPALGQWKLEGRYSNFLAYAPKVYSYTDEEGVFQARAKGVPLGRTEAERIKAWKGITQGEATQLDRGVLSFRSAARANHVKGLFVRVDRSRLLQLPTDRIGDRVLLPNGETLAPECPNE
jgi:hypothetical protein